MLCKHCGLEKELHDFELRSNGKYRAQCRNCVSQRRSKYYLKNQDTIKSKTVSYAQSNKNKADLYKQKWVAKNPEKRREVNRVSELRRRAAKKSIVADKFSMNDIITVYGNNCVYCGGKFEHIDHYVPLSKGGPHSLNNVRPSCESCNLRKGSKMPEDFERQVNLG